MGQAEEIISNVMHANWLSALVTQRDIWLGRRSGRRIVEELDRVQLFERDRLVLECPVVGGLIEDAKASALTMALEADRLELLREPSQTG